MQTIRHKVCHLITALLVVLTLQYHRMPESITLRVTLDYGMRHYAWSINYVPQALLQNETVEDCAPCQGGYSATLLFLFSNRTLNFLHM